MSSARGGQEPRPPSASDEEVEVVEGVNFNSARTTRSQATLLPKNDPDDLPNGYCNCPVCGRGTFFQEGCRTVVCRNKVHKTVVRFCIFCKKQCEAGEKFVICKACPDWNSRENREMVHAQLQLPVDLCGSGDEGGEASSAEDASTNPSLEMSSAESNETERRRQDSDEDSWHGSGSEDEGSDNSSFVDDEQSPSELKDDDVPPAKRIKTDPVKSEETDEEAFHPHSSYFRLTKVKEEFTDVKVEDTDAESSSSGRATSERQPGETKANTGSKKTKLSEKQPARKKSHRAVSGRKRPHMKQSVASAPHARPKRSAASKAAAALSRDTNEEGSESDGDSLKLDETYSAGSEEESSEEVEYDGDSLEQFKSKGDAKKPESRRKASPRRAAARRDGGRRRVNPRAGKSPDELWDENYAKLREYKEEHGHCNVPYNRSQKDGQLEEWVKYQRKMYKKKKLSDERKERLEQIGLQWSFVTGRAGAQKTLDERFEQLKAYKSEHGDCNVPKRYVVDGFQLGQWVMNQRTMYTKGRLSNDRKKRLEQIGFQWIVRKDTVEQWDERFEQLKAYESEHGHCSVPQKYTVDGFQLGQWVTTQRQRHKKGKLRPDLLRRLEEIRFQWSVRSEEQLDEKWNDWFEQLKAYKRENGNCNVPRSYVVYGFQLGQWVHTQRDLYKKGKLSEERKERLDAIGFQWSGSAGAQKIHHEQWDKRFEQLQAYKREHGDCNVPQRYVVDGAKLGHWVSKQRQRHKEGKLSLDRKERLDKIGFQLVPSRGRKRNE